MTTSFSFSRDPLQNFEILFQKAEAQIPQDPNAMSLSTCSELAVPSVRTVLFKGMVRGGFSFYTNYESQKAQELLKTKRAAALFFWAPLATQIRIDGIVEKLTVTESETYFKTRPRISQIGAWASHQSQKMAGLEELEARAQEFEKKFLGQDIPCPANWGGFHILPQKIEFWFGRVGRMHERYVYERDSVAGSWQCYMKSP